jgi:hypothetical protein
MAVTWGALFMNKHIHIVQRTMTSTDMASEGYRIWQERNGSGAVKNAQYGKIKPPISTLMVMNQGSFEKLRAKANTDVVAAGTHYTFDIIGAIVHVEAEQVAMEMWTTHPPRVGSFGTMTVSAIVAGANFEINHLVAATVGDQFDNYKISRGGSSFDIPA